jgi:DNA-binding CsgD family transcriptional regulator
VYHAVELVGRAPELEQLGALVDGDGGALLLEGPPGVGKSALLQAVAAASGVRVLAVTGVETEIDLPFAGLAELLHPVLDHIDRLPEPQRGALRAALALDAPRGDDRAVVLHAVAASLAALAPLLVAADDVQWLDPSSRSVVEYIARRAGRLGIAVVAVRSLRGQPAEPWPGVARLELGELPRAQALRLARRQGVAAGVAQALVDALGGNPLALVEAPAELTAAQRAGAELLPAPLPSGRRLQEVYAARVAALPSRTRRALLLAAASEDGAAGPLLAALDGDGDAFGPAEDAGLVRADPQRVRFAHPLLRSAVYHAALPSERRAAHRALAASTPAPGSDWHLAVAATAPDERLAAALERLAHEAGGRGAPATAAVALERAARLSPEPAAGAARTLAAAHMATLGGQPERARALLDRLLPAVADPATRADVQLLRGIAMLQVGRPMEAYALLDAEAERIAPADPARAAGLLTQAGVALMAHGTVDRLAALAERARRLAPPELELAPAILRVQALTALGAHGEARELLAAREAVLAGVDPVLPGHELLAIAALSHIYLERYDAAERLLARLVEAGRERGAVGALVLPLAVGATLHLRRGRLAEAEAAATEAESLGEDALDGFVFSLALAAVALVAAHRGDASRCREAADRMLALGTELELTSTLACAEQALGLLALSGGDADTAVRHLEGAHAHTAALGTRDPGFLFTAADLAEAAVRAGDVARAAALADELEAGARATGGAWAAAAAARCRALVDDPARLDEHFAAAMAAHARVAMPFELARTQLCFGERLRRSRRPAAARGALSAAHARFVACGAPAWAARAAHELAAAGGVREDGAMAGLTAREREVCRLVAAGATNREAAAALFLSPRTVEHHLRLAYRKLGVRSRSDLILRWTGEVP